jgi:glycosyltransferase involved in cell wall biosynthesis
MPDASRDRTDSEPAATAREYAAGRRVLPFLAPFVGRGAAALAFGADEAWLTRLRDLGFHLCIVDTDRARVDDLRRRNFAVEKFDFLTAAERAGRAALDIVLLAPGAQRMAIDAQRAIVGTIVGALKPGGLAILHVRRDLLPATQDPGAILPHVLAPIGANGAFLRACVVPLGAARRPDMSDYVVIAQKDGQAQILRRFDTAFARIGFDLGLLAFDRDAALRDHFARIETNLLHIEMAVQNLIDWQSTLAAMPAPAPEPEKRSRVRAHWANWLRPLRPAQRDDSSPAMTQASAEDSEAALVEAEPKPVRLAFWRLKAAQALARETSERKSSGLPRLAFVSPLPPQKSGVANYSAELLPGLAAHYEIDVVIDDDAEAAPAIAGVRAIRNAAWFRRNAGAYDRILYHFGNSEFHAYMILLLQDFPGIVVLHDFFLGDLLRPLQRGKPDWWMQILAEAHGYGAARFQAANHDNAEASARYPANLFVIEQASGIVVTSQYARKLGSRFYGAGVGDDWAVVEHMRTAPGAVNRAAARKALGLADDDLLVCAFGYLVPTKCNDFLLQAWGATKLDDDARAHLVFVGGAPPSAYGDALRESIAGRTSRSNVSITGFVAPEIYALYLAAADFAVQLRRQTRGESSYSVFECMAHGLPVIVNAHGPMAELPRKAVVMLDDACEARDLANALETLAADPAMRRDLGRRAQETIHTTFSPAVAARKYFDAIERMSQVASGSSIAVFAKAANELAARNAQIDDWLICARNLAGGTAERMARRRILVDVSSLVHEDLRTGIQRVVRAQLLSLIDDPPPDFRIEAVWLDSEQGAPRLRHARRYLSQMLEIDILDRGDDPVEVRGGDIYFTPDFFAARVIEAAKSNVYAALRARGVRLAFSVYDVLPIERPDFFPAGADVRHADWLRTVAEQADVLICISHDTARRTEAWIGAHASRRPRNQRVCGLHLGADIQSSAPTKGAPEESAVVDGALLSRPTFLAVGTIEPRKGYLQLLAAFDLLWAEGFEANLVIVGAEGWKHVDAAQRRTIAEIVEKVRGHPELGQRLFWLERASDEYLDTLYAQSSCLVAASEAEGFGLPLVEAARAKLPILARDISVFREIAGDCAFYFDGLNAARLAGAIRSWLLLYAEQRHPKTDDMPWSTWRDNGAHLAAILTSEPVAHEAPSSGAGLQAVGSDR